MASDELKSSCVCENCRFRKIKCDRSVPCANCVTKALKCQYLPTLRGRRPNERRGRRIKALKPLSELKIGADDHRRRHVVDHTKPHRAEPPTESFFFARDTSQQFSSALFAHVSTFQDYLYPIMPVVDVDEILRDTTRLKELAPSRYALILSICAATRIQLRMDYAESCFVEKYHEYALWEPHLKGETLVGLADNALRQVDVISDVTLDSILACFFLHTAYINLNDLRRAVFYLNQSLTLILPQYDICEPNRIDYSQTDNENRRRVYWLLFATERVFALQHKQRVMLPDRVPKPQTVNPGDSVVLQGLINHTCLLELLPLSIFEWCSLDNGHPFQHAAQAFRIDNMLCAIRPEDSAIESQHFGTLITQQWLRTLMWRLVFKSIPCDAPFHTLPLPLDLPIDTARTIMAASMSSSQGSKNCHGIAMERMFFDVGTSLAAIARVSGCSVGASKNDPRDLLHGIVKILSQIRGCKSCFLPMLLEHCEDVLNCVDPYAGVDVGWWLDQQTAASLGNKTTNSVSTQTEESMNTRLMVHSQYAGALKSAAEPSHLASPLSVEDGLMPTIPQAQVIGNQAFINGGKPDYGF